jgi:hypothetical protein
MRRAVWGGGRGDERHVYVLLGLKRRVRAAHKGVARPRSNTKQLHFKKLNADLM